MFEKQDLFEARLEGYQTYRIPGLLVTPRGVVLATTEARRGRGGDYDQNDVLMRRSLDGGRTWQPRRKIVDADGTILCLCECDMVEHKSLSQ